jgi:8-oxo-dGTP pyrophosphatase MutT (NUDIX family)
MKGLAEEITSVVSKFPDQGGAVGQRYLERVKEGQLTRDENVISHLCVYFLPYNHETGQVFIIHHRKANKWLSPGGHIDRGEDLLTALNREIKEELGVPDVFAVLPDPFLISITPIDNNTQPCKEHLDVWFLSETDGKNFNVDPHEFYTAKWATLEEARKDMIDPANLQALEILSLK